MAGEAAFARIIYYPFEWGYIDMSKYKLIAVAVAAALAAPAAFATTVTVGTPGSTGPAVLASNAFIDATVVASNINTPIEIKADANSVYLGRTTGYNIRLTLSQGVFSANPSVSLLGATDSASIAGGGNNGNTVTFAVTPDVALGVREGDGITIPASALSVDAVAALGAGGTVSIKVQVFDPVGGNQLGTDINATVIQTVEGWKVDYFAGADSQRIDVGAASGKKWFGGTAVNSGSAVTTFNAGRVVLDTAYTNGLDSFVPLTNNATFALVISGADFSAFRAPGAVYLATAATCPTAGSIPAAVSADGLSASIPATTTLLPFIAVPYICFDGTGTTVIAAQDISASVVVSQANAIPSPSFGSGDTLLSLKYNGPVVDVNHFNPASNANQESYLRISNPSATPGLVTVDGVCDDGTAGTPASFTLGAGQSRLLTSKTLELGTGLNSGLGSCTAGKWRLVVTGEFAEMKVQNFLRNVTTAGMINTNVNNED